MAKKRDWLPSTKEVERFDMLIPLFHGMHAEIRELSKKKQTEALNKFKAEVINRVLDPIRDLMKDEPTAEFLELIDVDTLPTNSDALLILSLYLAAMRLFMQKYKDYDPELEEDSWLTSD